MKNFEKMSGAEVEEPQSELELKGSILRAAMYASQPTFDEFIGRRGYPEAMIEADAEDLADKMGRIIEDNRRYNKQKDRYAEEAEPVVTYIFNDRRFLPTRETFGVLAHEYDDKLNGADVVFGVENKQKTGYITCVADVTTATDFRAVQDKFAEHREWHRRTPPYCSYVKYCRHGGQYWREPEAPNFVVGVMPASVDEALEHIKISPEGLIQGRERDDATDFKLMSEIHEQINLQLSVIGKNPSDVEDRRLMENLRDLRGAVVARLCRLVGAEGEDKKARIQDLNAKYPQFVKKAREDLTYRNIIDCVAREKHRILGEAAMK